MRQSDNQDYEQYVALILAKIYLSHLRCCNQSYELRLKNSYFIRLKDDPLVYEINYFVNYYDSRESDLPVELYTSGIILDWMEQKPGLLSYLQLKEVYQKILAERERIERGDL